MYASLQGGDFTPQSVHRGHRLSNSASQSVGLHRLHVRVQDVWVGLRVLLKEDGRSPHVAGVSSEVAQDDRSFWATGDVIDVFIIIQLAEFLIQTSVMMRGSKFDQNALL